MVTLETNLFETLNCSATSEYLPGKNPDEGYPPSAMTESKRVPLKLSSMNFPRIGVRSLLFTHTIVQKRTGM